MDAHMEKLLKGEMQAMIAKRPEFKQRSDQVLNYLDHLSEHDIEGYTAFLRSAQKELAKDMGATAAPEGGCAPLMTLQAEVVCGTNEAGSDLRGSGGSVDVSNIVTQNAAAENQVTHAVISFFEDSNAKPIHVAGRQWKTSDGEEPLRRVDIGIKACLSLLVHFPPRAQRNCQGARRPL